MITEEQLNEALTNKRTDEKLGDVLLERHYITEKQLIEVLEFQLGIPHVQLYHYPIEREALGYVPKELCQERLVMPLKVSDNTLMLAMNDPMDYFTIDDIEMLAGLRISPAIAAKDDILFAINKHFEQVGNSEGAEVEETSIIQLLDQILQSGIQLKASDIHIEPHDASVNIRYRIDGRLQTDRVLPKNVLQPLVARIKILANQNITETRLPQDGRIKTMVGFTPVDLRISSLPTMYGEKIVIRILELKNALRKLTELHFSENNYKRYTELLNRPSGLILLTGPTGSGKTTTLYASLNYLNKEDVNIVTVEDPVEYQIEGINQVQVNNAIGLNFAIGLRSILRQDPNIIMVGEIRDQETAEIAVRSSLTGHLVFSTLHTNSAMATVPRLMDMGIEPYLVVSSLSGIVAQRLVRRVCRDCRTEREPTKMEQDIFKKHNMTVERLYHGKGCSSCHQQGFRGRLAVHELITIDDHIRNLLLNHGSLSDVTKYVREQGTTFLVEDGLQKAKEGLTTIEEVLQVSISL